MQTVSITRIDETAVRESQFHLSKLTIRNVFVPAVFLFVTINLVAGIIRPATSLLINDMPKKPDVLFAGSSVLAIPLWFCEYKDVSPVVASRFKQERLQRMTFFERFLGSSDHSMRSCWNIAVQGQSLQQTAETIDQNLVGDQRPKVLVLGISPIWALGDESIAPSQFEARKSKLKNLLKPFRGLTTWREVACSDLHKRTNHFYKTLNLLEPRWRRWQRIQDFYVGAYNHPLSRQSFESLRHIARTCNKRSIKLIVVSTPLAQANRDLLTSVKYQRYVRTVHDTIGSCCDFLDFGESRQFDNNDFDDPAHLDQIGGDKLMGKFLAPEVSRLLSEVDRTVDATRSSRLERSENPNTLDNGLSSL